MSKKPSNEPKKKDLPCGCSLWTILYNDSKGKLIGFGVQVRGNCQVTNLTAERDVIVDRLAERDLQLKMAQDQAVRLKHEVAGHRALLAELQPFLNEERLRKAVDVALGRAPLEFGTATEGKA